MWTSVRSKKSITPFAVGLCLVATGCYAPASPRPLLKKDRPAQRTAILPVLPSDVTMVVHGAEAPDSTRISSNTVIKNREKIASTCNAVLDTLAAGSQNPLQGPSKTQAALGASQEWERLHVYLDDPEPLDSAWKQAGLTELFGKLGISQIVLVKPTVDVVRSGGNVGGSGSGMGGGEIWDGTVRVSVELLRLSPPRIVARSTGQAKHWSMSVAMAVDGVIIPLFFGKTFRRSLDQAARDAFSQLFNPQTKGEPSK